MMCWALGVFSGSIVRRVMLVVTLSIVCRFQRTVSFENWGGHLIMHATQAAVSFGSGMV